MNKEEKCARAWINKKLKSGVTQSELYNGVGLFSNKDKEIVKSQKRLSEKQYKKRLSFMEKVFYLLSTERF